MTNEVSDNGGTHRRQDDEPKGGIPKRGIAMILIAVAVILLLWAIYYLTRDNDSTTEASQPQPTTTAAMESAAPQPSATTAQSRQPEVEASAPSAQPEQPPLQPAPAPAPAADGPPAPAPAPAPAMEMTKDSAQVFVYNNSPNPGLAGETADGLRGEFTVANFSQDTAEMNLPEQEFGVFPESMVFFDPSTSGAEQVADELAQRLGAVATPIGQLPPGTSLPAEVRNNRQAVSVVLAS